MRILRRLSSVHVYASGMRTPDAKVRRPHFPARQHGVAVITALLLTTLAITIVASLFWQQQVQVRSIENQRLQLQKQWILRGALDFAVLILKEDGKHSAVSAVDDLSEPWAVPMQDTPLDQYVENGRTDTEASDASLSGSIVDAQSRFNLRNMVPLTGATNPREIEAFGRLLTNLQLNPSLAQATADLMIAAQQKTQVAAGANGTPGSTGDAQPMNIMYVDDLLSVPGFTSDTVAKLKDYVVVLKDPTMVNANTASAEVLAAKSPNGELSLADAVALVAGRERMSFKNITEFSTRSNIKSPVAQDFDVKTRYFLINGKVRLSRASMDMQALIFREYDGSKANVVWIRES